MNDILKKNSLLIIILVLSALLFLLYRSDVTTLFKENENSILVILPQTGSLSTIGEQIKSGIDLARLENKNDTIIVKYEDSKGNAKDGINALNRGLLDKPKFTIINLTSVSMASKGILKTSEFNALLLSTHPEILTDCNNCYRFFTNGKQEAKLILEEIEKDKELSKIGLLYVKDAYGEGTINYVKNNINKKIDFIDLPYPIKGFDFQKLITRAKSENVDTLIIIGYGFEYKDMFEKIKLLNFNPKIYSNFSFSNKKGKEIFNNYKNKITYTTPVFDTENKKNSMNDFIKKYKKKYDVLPDFNAAYGYDNFKIIASYIESKSKNETLTFKEFLKNFNYQGAMGTYKFLDDGDVETELMIIKK